tara:strand:- start:1875 stop:2531 length:657 start_codon:yes stop_codon:yes gene_type:complete
MVDQDLLAYLEEYLTAERKARFYQVLEQRTKFITVAIEDVFQIHNASAVVRSCEVFGIQEAHVITQRFDRRLDKNIAMGAQQWVDIDRYGNSSSCIQHLREQGYSIIATTPQKNACRMDEFEINAKTALFFGTEKEGLSQEVLTQCDAFLRIPMAGFTKSLNISVSAAILLQYYTTKLRKSELPWPLTENEKREKRLDWAMKSIPSIDDILARYHGIK